METVNVGYETSLNEYVKQERTAVQLINSIGELMFNKGIELVLFRNHLVDISISEFCLLYTSPSPRDQSGSRMPSSA